MKQFIHKYTLLASLALLSIPTMVSCSNDDEPDASKSVLAEQLPEKTSFDQWLDKNYLDAYNVDFIYRMLNNETPRERNLAPATLENSMRMAKIVKHSWFSVYDEVGGYAFMRKYAPRQILLIGSRSTDKTSMDLLGTAEGGLKVTLYKVNHIDINNLAALKWTYFGTIHHEFAHILHQHKRWPDAFNEVTKDDYLPSTWANGDVARRDVYAPLGFVTAYSRKVNSEDVAEVTAAIITWTQAEWDALYQAAGEAGTAKIKKKVAIMKQYMLDEYKIDLDKLREVADRRLEEAARLNFIEEDWKPLINNTLRGLRAASNVIPFAPASDNNAWTKPDLPTEGAGDYSCGVYLQHCGKEPFTHHQH